MSVRRRCGDIVWNFDVLEDAGDVVFVQGVNVRGACLIVGLAIPQHIEGGGWMEPLGYTRT